MVAVPRMMTKRGSGKRRPQASWNGGQPCNISGLGCKSLFGQLSREKSLIARRCEMKGNSGHTSKANFGGDICEFESSHPSQPVRSLLFDFRVWVNHSPSDSSGKDRERHLSSIARLRHLRRCHHVVLWLLTSSNQNRRLASMLIAFVSAVASHED